jgi:2,3-bisphosphoglycerate-independent phosphoglycerate mutase
MKKLGTIVQDIIDYCKKNDIDLLITADHGNCEAMWNADHPNTAHSLNLVPFRYIKKGEVVPTRAKWWLYDIAPTVLKLMWLKIPKEMTGKSLI